MLQDFSQDPSKTSKLWEKQMLVACVTAMKATYSTDLNFTMRQWLVNEQRFSSQAYSRFNYLTRKLNLLQKGAILKFPCRIGIEKCLKKMWTLIIETLTKSCQRSSSHSYYYKILMYGHVMAPCQCTHLQSSRCLEMFKWCHITRGCGGRGPCILIELNISEPLLSILPSYLWMQAEKQAGKALEQKLTLD